ncbi:MAG: hypothetical protein WBI82_10400 [Sphaerochaeta sp.]
MQKCETLLLGCVSNTHIAQSLADGIGGLFHGLVENMRIDILGGFRVLVAQMLAYHLHRYTHVDQERGIGVAQEQLT